MTRVLVLYTAVGHGIKIVAQNIYERLKRNAEFDVRIDDVYAVAPGPHVSMLENIYFYFTETFPFIWGFLYSEFVASLTVPLRMFMASLKYRKILKVLKSYEPDIVISTETVPSGIVYYLKRKGWYRGKLVIVFSDYHLHRFWLYDEADMYWCVTRQQAKDLLTLGVPEEKIALTGMIVSEKHLQNVPRENARARFGLRNDSPVVLLSGGRRGLLASPEIVSMLFARRTPFQIVVVTGKNRQLKERLESLRGSDRHPLKIFGYVTDQEILMTAADVVISKPGGLTIAEAVCYGLPVVLADAHPGHETRNLEYLVREGIAWHGASARAAANLAEQMLTGKIKPDMAAAYEKIIKPQGGVGLTQALKRLI